MSQCCHEKCLTKQPGRREVEKSDGGDLNYMGEGIFKSALPREKYFLCIFAVSVMSSGSQNLAEKAHLLLSIFHASVILWVYVHAYVKISYFSYFFSSCFPTSEDLLDTKQALFEHFPCSSTGMLQSVLLKRKKKRLIILVLCFFILNA